MEKTKKIRNHISIVAEEIWSGVLVLIVLIFTQVLPELAEVSEADLSFLTGKALWILLGAAALLFILIGSRLLVWARTYIYIEDNAIIIEKNTVNKKKNTIGIRNISNINLEQNLFEMLIGTCKIKLDTNSLSTADKTDVKIILKKADAEAFRREITNRLQQDSEEAKYTKESDTEERPGKNEKRYISGQASDREVSDEDYDIRADMGDIISHGLFSINIFSVILLLGGIAATVGAVIQVIQNPGFVRSLLGAAAGILVAASIVLSAAWDTVKDFIRYYDFRAKRRGDRLYIRYGLLKKMEYTVPVDKIQALQISQTLVARLSGRYMAEIINVGMGDEAQEKNSFLLLYCTEEKLKERLNLLLPELAQGIGGEMKKQPGKTWAVWAFPLVVFTAVTAAAAAAGAALTGGIEPSGRFPVLAGIWGGAGALVLLVMAGMLLSYRTASAGAGEEELRLCRGYFGRHYTIVKYSKIQYVDFSRSFLAKKCGIRKGEIHLLAAAGKASYTIPYFEDNLEEKIKRGMLRR